MRKFLRWSYYGWAFTHAPAHRLLMSRKMTVYQISGAVVTLPLTANDRPTTDLEGLGLRSRRGPKGAGEWENCNRSVFQSSRQP
ncbi:unnamed protein product [Anisakis simplex]|uniref:Secreted protein n=1 Tax=Anisakis simplex TaxID=6269 RepID=A0A0M3J1A2_ANISI|nr:unnamed protein product [Anisakis simplex]